MRGRRLRSGASPDRDEDGGDRGSSSLPVAARGREWREEEIGSTERIKARVKRRLDGPWAISMERKKAKRFSRLVKEK